MENAINPLVCFFDSGIGGLSLLYECVRKLPCVDFCYFADNYRVPYGDLSKAEMIKLVDEKFTEINSLNPAAAVVACNTVTAQCVDFLRQKYDFEILGIQPAVKPAAQLGGKCVVLATPSTAQSAALNALVKTYGGDNVFITACPELAAYIENNYDDISLSAADKYLPDLSADVIVLGCTHYSLIKDIIRAKYNCQVIDGTEGTANRLCKILGNSAHRTQRAQEIAFKGGNTDKNREIFRKIIRANGGLSLF